jgi:hypothetical protein
MAKLLLDSLRIVNFRAFKDLKINKLGRVNLIVGKNNVGKTSVLEALWLYANRGAPAMMRDLLEARDETKLPGSAESEDPEARAAALRYLFHGREHIAPDSEAIRIGQIDAKAQTLAISVKWMEQRFDKDGNLHFTTVQPGSSSLGKTLLVAELRIGTAKGQIFGLGQHFDTTFSRSGLPTPFDEIRLTNVFVLSSGPSSRQMANWRDRSVIAGKKEHVLGVLRIIAPEVEDVDLVTGRPYGMEAAGRIPVVKLKDLKEYIPLRSLGDGMNRLFGLALALVNAENGMLMIDEIENGLHYSIQPDMWSLILKTARDLNVQVFATTHSTDCVEAFSKVTGEDEEEGVLILLGRKGDQIVSTTFDEEELAIATEQNIDVR